MISRLQQLTTARDQLNREIERERAYLRRAHALKSRIDTALVPTSDSLIALVAEAFHVTPAMIHGTSRRYARPRHVVMWLLRDAGMSLPAIGATLGRDHTSVLYGVRRVERDGELLAVARGLVEKRSA